MLVELASGSSSSARLISSRLSLSLLNSFFFICCYLTSSLNSARSIAISSLAFCSSRNCLSTSARLFSTSSLSWSIFSLWRSSLSAILSSLARESSKSTRSLSKSSYWRFCASSKACRSSVSASICWLTIYWASSIWAFLLPISCSFSCTVALIAASSSFYALILYSLSYAVSSTLNRSASFRSVSSLSISIASLCYSICFFYYTRNSCSCARNAADAAGFFRS